MHVYLILPPTLPGLSLELDEDEESHSPGVVNNTRILPSDQGLRTLFTTLTNVAPSSPFHSHPLPSPAPPSLDIPDSNSASIDLNFPLVYPPPILLSPVQYPLQS